MTSRRESIRKGGIMEMDEQRLKDIYQAGVRSAAPASRKDCPSPETMLKLLRSRLFGKKAARAIDHISRCGYCAGEFAFLLETIRHEKQFIEQAEQSLAPVRLIQTKASVPQESKAFFRRWRPVVRRLSWSPISLLAGLAVTGLAVAAFLVLRSPETYRSGGGTGLRLVQPVNREVSGSPLVFRWKAVAGSEYYALELFDKALNSIWKTDKVKTNEVVLPEETVRKLAPNSVYFWMVTAHFPDGEKRLSRLEKFTFRE
jgi:hypothetical protein